MDFIDKVCSINSKAENDKFGESPTGSISRFEAEFLQQSFFISEQKQRETMLVESPIALH